MEEQVDAPAEGWIPIPGPLPVAAALRAVGQWSLDGPARDFDGQDWWYRAQFGGAGQRTVLGLDGLATLAQVWLNGRLLLSSDNMFVAHRLDVAEALRAEGNELLIRCRSLTADLGRRRPRPRWRTPMVAHQQLRWLRTTLLGRTPGWSPPAAVVGPWRDIWLAEPELAHRADCHLDTRVDVDNGVLTCTLQLDPADAADLESAVIELTHEGRRWSQPLARTFPTHFAGTLRVDAVCLWWPHTHGEPVLYGATLRLRTRSGAEHVRNLGRVGFRTVTTDTANGAFQLRVNGVPVFCRGAGWTPLDPVSLRSTPQQCVDAIAQARSAGMNMLRVAGTTVYEQDHFYDACDEAGMLVWQDFMFASMDYPGDDAGFESSATREASQWLRRHRSRPCLAVLCGNSEVAQQAAMWGAPRELWQPALFHQTLSQLCEDQAPAIPYWPSSAWGGAFPHQADAGTTSYYGVGAYLRPLEDARRSGLKFATECLAFANIPQDSALARMPGGLATRAHHAHWKERSPRDLGAGWDFDDVRDHYLGLLFGVDPHRLRHTDHDRYLALGRLATGQAMTAAFSEWRRPESGCGGALLLFLQDLWAGAGWGVIDDAGQPKACLHALRRVLQPVTVLLTDEGGNGLFAHLVNEHAEPRDVVLEVGAWQGGDVRVAQGRQAFTLQPRGAITVPCVSLLGHFMDLGYAYRFGPPPCDVVSASLTDADGRVIARAVHFPVGLSADQHADIGMQAQVEWTGADTATLTLSTRQLALGVHFDIPGYRAADEHFHLVPGETARVALQAQRPPQPLAGTVAALNSKAGARVAAGLPSSTGSGGKT